MQNRPGPSVLKYQKGIRSGSSTNVIIGQCRSNSDVLDVGCASGYLGVELNKIGCRTWGVDIDRFALTSIPDGIYSEITEMDLNLLGEQGPFFPRLFDVIILADVLEHLVDPGRILSILVKSLKADGELIVSLPNVANVSVRASLLVGHFDYVDRGILDKTHLHLYTYASAARLVQSCGLEIKKSRAGSDRFGTILNKWPKISQRVATLLAYNIIYVCKVA